MKTAAAKLGILAMLSIGPVGLGQTTLHTTTTLVVVPTVVQTSNHETVFSLSANDFVLTDNGAPQRYCSRTVSELRGSGDGIGEGAGKCSKPSVDCELRQPS
jgi:hypothetical protein